MRVLDQRFKNDHCLLLSHIIMYSLMAEPRVKILLLVFMSEIKIDPTLKKSNFLFLLCFKITIKWVSNHDRATASFLVVLHQI